MCKERCLRCNEVLEISSIDGRRVYYCEACRNKIFKLDKKYETGN